MLNLLNRNYDNDNHSSGQDGREWGHALLWQFSSGYTQYTVGVGIDRLRIVLEYPGTIA